MLVDFINQYTWVIQFLIGMYLALVLVNGTIRHFTFKVIFAVLIFALTTIRDLLNYILGLLTRGVKPPEQPRPVRQATQKPTPKNSPDSAYLEDKKCVVLEDAGQLKEWFEKNPDLAKANGVEK